MQRMTEEEKKEIIERNAYYNNMSYEEKVDIATARVLEWTETCADAGANYAVSVGGLDSIVLLLFVRKILGECDGISVSSLEDLSIQRVHKELGVKIIKPDLNFVEVLNKFGFPVCQNSLLAKLNTYKYQGKRLIRENFIITTH